jgi:hypothetical protein
MREANDLRLTNPAKDLEGVHLEWRRIIVSMGGVRRRIGSTRVTGTFVRHNWLKLVAISLVLIAPCLWHHHIEAGDLGSHLYNAWLAQQIEQGHAPGLWIASQWQNVLFDVSLSRLGGLVGLPVAERVCVSAAALLFFWSVFALICAASRRVPWSLIPCVAILTYGWTFHTGLFNYYISCALSFLGLAIFWRGAWWERIGVIALAPLVLVAHPVGVIWLIGATALLLVAESIRPRYHLLLPLGAAGVLLLIHSYLSSHFALLEPDRIEYLINGTDQLVVFGSRYDFLAGAMFAFGLACFIVDVVARKHEGGFWKRYGLPLQLYFCAQAGILFLPGAVYLPHYGAPFSLIQERISLISATMACCIVALIQPRKWHLIGFGAVAAVFFTFLYQDTGSLSKMEDRVDQLVQTVPPGDRVMETISTDPDWRAYVNHILDRACIGRCFAFGNYEPSTNQFRVRARRGNRIVMTSFNDTEAMERGTYRVQPRDLPAYQIYQCSANVMDLCIRELGNGETNNKLRERPEGVPH